MVGGLQQGAFEREHGLGENGGKRREHAVVGDEVVYAAHVELADGVGNHRRGFGRWGYSCTGRRRRKRRRGQLRDNVG
jgi:hypothetical protein